MDNSGIARVFTEIGDLLEIRGENPFKIRAYRNAADTIAHLGEAVARLSAADRLGIPGIGKDLAAKLGELIDTGACRFHAELLQQFPAGVLDLLRLQGVGPKTVALLYNALQVTSLDDLERAGREGRIRALKGMGSRKEAMILKALEDRRQVAGRRLAAEARETAGPLLESLRLAAPAADITLVGSLRRGADTSGDLDLLAAGADRTLMDALVSYAGVERVLGHGETKSSVLLQGGFQADLRIVARESLGAGLQYFTGSKAHNIALRDRAVQRGFKLNEYGLFRVADDTRVAGATESEIYEALGLAFIPPELRENRGEFAAAEGGTLPALVERADIRGDLHMHTTATDGRADAETMARAALASGLEYAGITDHSQSLAMANGLDEARALAHARGIRELNARLEGITMLAGIECDILPDGRMDLADDCLAELDFVVASVHSAFSQEASQMTDRLLRALACPWVDILAHPTGRLLLKRSAYAFDIDQVFRAAADAGVALEINSQADRLDLDDALARLARDRGVTIVIGSDAHSPAALAGLARGVTVARRAWLRAPDILNTRPLAACRAGFRRHRRSPGP